MISKIFQLVSTKVLFNFIVGILEILAKRTDNHIDDDVVQLIKDVRDDKLRKDSHSYDDPEKF